MTADTGKPDGMSLRFLRIVRWVQIAGLLACTGDLMYAIQGGNPDGIAFLAAMFVIFWLALIVAQTRVIHCRDAQLRARMTRHHASRAWRIV